MNDRPDIKYLNRHVKPFVCGACDKNPEVWKVLGIELLGQESETALNTISADSRGSVVACCSGMFSLWLERQPEASWRLLIDALINVKLLSLAAGVKRLLTPSEQQNRSQVIPADLQGTTKTKTGNLRLSMNYFCDFVFKCVYVGLFLCVVCMHVFVSVCVCTCACACVRVFVSVVCVHACICVCMRACVMWMNFCICAMCMHVCDLVYVSMYISMCTF